MILEKNIIKKLTVEVDTNSMAIALQLKDNLDSFLKEKIYPIIDAHLTKNSSQKNTISIDKIELSFDLENNSSLDELTRAINEKLPRYFEEQKSNNLRTETREQSTAKRRIDAFLFFLKEGVYPWWFDKNEIFNTKDINELKKDEILTVLNYTYSIDRLVYQFDIKIIKKIFYILIESSQKSNNLLGNIPNSIDEKQLFKLAFQYQLKQEESSFGENFWKFIDNTLFTNHTVQRKTILIKKDGIKKVFNLLKYCCENLKIPIQISAINSNDNTYTFKLENNLKKAIKKNKEFEKIIAKKPSVNLLQNEKVLHKKKSQKSEDKLLPITPNNLKVKNDYFLQKNDSFAEEVLGDGILINNAGLILIHPFIKHFFEKLEFLSDGNIKSEKIDEAVHVLHYLASGKEQPQEQFLKFEKYLCNIPLQYPIKRDIKLTDRQKNACEELLDALLGHWSGLKSDNIDLLRNEFLLREGKLTISKERDILYIQRKTQDILLDSLPWNIHLVKIPWKKKIMFVEW